MFVITWNDDLLPPEPCAVCGRMGIPPLGAAILYTCTRWHVCDRCAPTHAPDLHALMARARSRTDSPDDVLDIYVPGRLRCPQCGFELMRATLHATTGEVGMTRRQMFMDSEPCPNDGTPMVRVTWREEAEANQQYAVSLITDVLAATHTDALPDALRVIQRLFADAHAVVAVSVVCDQGSEPVAGNE